MGNRLVHTADASLVKELAAAGREYRNAKDRVDSLIRRNWAHGISVLTIAGLTGVSPDYVRDVTWRQSQ